MQDASNGSNDKPIITFDKDDEDTLDFVTASANLRSIVFGIETKSRFDTKQMAGNIIPAIATTNAIVAGLCVLQSFKVLRGDFSSVKEVSQKLCTARLMITEPLYNGPKDMQTIRTTFSSYLWIVAWHYLLLINFARFSCLHLLLRDFYRQIESETLTLTALFAA
jgi:hypothetical protein